MKDFCVASGVILSYLNKKVVFASLSFSAEIN